MRRLSLLLGLAPLLSSCAKDTPPDIVLDFTPGMETGAWTETPVPARMVVKSSEGGGTPTSIADVAWPADSLSMGSLTSGATYSFTAELRDANGNVVMRGITPSMGSDDVSGDEVPVLCGRVGEMARPDDGLTLAWTQPFVAYVESRFAFVANGTQQSELYDFVYLTPYETTSALPLAPTAMAPLPGDGVLIVTASEIDTYSLDDGSVGAVSTGLDPATLAGASAIVGGDGTAYLVGATRSGTATASVLRITTDGTITAHTLQTPRAQAAAAWVNGTGLVVLGGAATTTAEILSATSDTFNVVDVALPTIQGGVAASLANGEILLAGALDASNAPLPVMRVTLTCDPCPAPATAADAIDLPSGASFSLAPTGAATTGSSGALLVGAAAKGTTAAYLLSEAGQGTMLTVSPVALKAPRSKATAISLGDGRVAIFGGVDSTGVAVESIEIFTPP